VKKVETKQVRILKQLERAFDRHRRRSHGRTSYPKPLKELALSVIASGIAPGAIAEAASISRQSLANWQRVVNAKPRELLLVDDVSPMSESEVKVDPSPVARIRLCSGVSIEVPVSAVTPSLLVALGGVR
jgi:hypothetical protein